MSDNDATPLGLLATLVSFDTTSHKSNLDFIAYVRDFLARFGVAASVLHDASGHKANLFATIGPAGQSGIALSGHSDVVPVADQNWSSDPFQLRAAEGRLHGRGTADMKGFLACVLAAVPDLARRRLTTPIHIAITYDEEVGCLGVRPLVAAFGQPDFPRPRFVIVGEPTSMKVVDAHKGPVRWRVDVTGRAAHSSMAHLGVNAITHAGLIVSEISRMSDELARAARDDRYIPPFATLEVTTIDGGTAANIIPVSCTFGLEVRSLDGLDANRIEERLLDAASTQTAIMQRVAPECGVTVTRTNAVVPFSAGAGSDATALALAWTGSNETHAVSYATEAGFFQAAGAQSIVCGPGDIAQAHTADEWIAETQLAECTAFLNRMADWAERH